MPMIRYTPEQIVETQRRECNESRPHQALGETIPNDFMGMQAAEDSR